MVSYSPHSARVRLEPTEALRQPWWPGCGQVQAQVQARVGSNGCGGSVAITSCGTSNGCSSRQRLWSSVTESHWCQIECEQQHTLYIYIYREREREAGRQAQRRHWGRDAERRECRGEHRRARGKRRTCLEVRTGRERAVAAAVLHAGVSTRRVLTSGFKPGTGPAEFFAAPGGLRHDGTCCGWATKISEAIAGEDGLLRRSQRKHVGERGCSTHRASPRASGRPKSAHEQLATSLCQEHHRSTGL